LVEQELAKPAPVRHEQTPSPAVIRAAALTAMHNVYNHIPMVAEPELAAAVEEAYNGFVARDIAALHAMQGAPLREV
jgi:hypothetical protein